MGTGSNSIENLHNIQWKDVDKILADPNQNASTQAVLADIPAELPPVQAVKPRALFQNSF